MSEVSFCEQLHILVPDGLKAQIHHAAAYEGMKQSEWIRAAIRERLQSMFNGPTEPPQGVAA